MYQTSRGSKILFWYLQFIVSLSTGTLGIYDIVYDMTGFDMSTTTKEDLHKDMVDEAVSVIAFTPDAQEVCSCSNFFFCLLSQSLYIYGVNNYNYKIIIIDANGHNNK